MNIKKEELANLTKEELEFGNHAYYRGIGMTHDNSNLKISVIFKNLESADKINCVICNAKGKDNPPYLDKVLKALKENFEVKEIIEENTDKFNYSINMVMVVAIKGQETYWG